MEPTFVGSKEDTTRTVIQEREGRGLRKEHPLGRDLRAHSPDLLADRRFRAGVGESPMEHPRARVPRLLAVTAAIILVAACGSSTSSGTPPATGGPSAPSPTTAASVSPTTAVASPSADPATVYAEIKSQVQAIRGLTATKPVDPKLLDEAQLKANITASFEKDNPPDVIDGQ